MSNEVSKARWLRTTYTYEVVIEHRDKYNRRIVRLYEATRRRAHYHDNGDWVWSVRGGGNRRDVLCDPDGATYKRVVAIAKAAANPDLISPRE